MNCEICGSIIHGPPERIVIEGSRLLACMKCSNLGEPDVKGDAPTLQNASTSRTRARPLGSPKSTKPTVNRLPREVEELEITEEFPKLIKKAREKNRMSQQDLAEAVKERLTIIQKIELGKMAPNLRLTHTLEHVLRIKLLLPRKEPEIPVSKMDQSELTLGDVIQYKKKTV